MGGEVTEKTRKDQAQEKPVDDRTCLYDRAEITTAGEAWEELMKGNRRYVAGKSADKDMVSRRIKVESGQDPFVTVITCSDSRVPPELLSYVIG